MVSCPAAPMDMLAINQRITIPAGANLASLSIPIVNDIVHEITEGFTVLLELVAGVTPAGVNIVQPNATTVEIIDNDG